MLTWLKARLDDIVRTPWLLWPAVIALMLAFVVGTVGWYGDFFVAARVPL